MAKIYNLYNHNIDPIGTATFDKAKNGYKVVYNDDVHYGNEFIPYEDFEAYKASMGINALAGRQVTLEELL